MGRVLVLAIAAFFLLTAGKAIAAPLIEGQPDSYDFGKRTIGEEYSYVFLDIYGTEEDPVAVTGGELIGTDADQFELQDWDCGGGVEVDQSTYCSFTIDFVPTTPGEKSVLVEIEAAGGDPISIPVEGEALEMPANAPDLAQATINLPLADTSDLWGYAGGDFEGLGRSGVVSVSQMDDFSVNASFAYGEESGMLSTPFGRTVSGGGFAGDAGVGDFDGDGDLDAVAAGGGTAIAYFNDGEGDMSTGTELPVDDEDGVDGRLAAGDFDGDGFDDVLGGYPTYDDDTGEYGYMLQMFSGDPDGTFEPPVSQQTSIDGPMGMASGDFDDDGLSDFAVSDFNGMVYMFTSDGDGTFTEADAFGGGSCGCASPWGVATGDLNGDGLDDVVVAMRFEDEIRTYLAKVDGTFDRGERISVPYADGWNPNPYAVSVGDLNGDAKPDVISGNYMNDATSVFVGNGDGTLAFAENKIEDPGFAAHGTFIGDFNGDGKKDPTTASQEGPVAVYLNEGEPGQVPSPASVDFGSVESGTTSTPVTVKLKNEGGLAELRLTDVSIGGGSSADFAFAGSDCGNDPIPVGQECEVFLVFKPVGPAGERGSSLYFGTNHSESTQVEVPLSGMATDPPPPLPGISIDPTSHDFGSVEVGSPGPTKTFTVKSTGEAPLVISRAVMLGSDPWDFDIGSTDCVTTLQPGATCSISLGFNPKTGAGAKGVTVRLVNDSANPGDIVLKGTATATPPPPPDPPKVLIKKRPKAKTLIGKRAKWLKQARVVFRGDQAGSSFRCRVDKKKFRSCNSPLILKKVKPGRHTVRIRATKDGLSGAVKVIKFRVMRRR